MLDVPVSQYILSSLERFKSIGASVLIEGKKCPSPGKKGINRNNIAKVFQRIYGVKRDRTLFFIFLE